MSVMLSHPSSCLLFLFLLCSGHLSAAATSIPGMTNRTARMLNRARRAKQSRAFLLAHNIARKNSGVAPLEWNKGMARFAYKWAKQRKPDCNMIHSGGPYGENIFWYRQRKMWSPEKVVTRWFEERFNYDRKTNTCTLGQMCGHYTQIVWRATTSVGCARVKCDNSRGYLVVCEYDPTGNYEGESPFDQTEQMKNVRD